MDELKDTIRRNEYTICRIHVLKHVFSMYGNRESTYHCDYLDGSYSLEYGRKCERILIGSNDESESFEHGSNYKVCESWSNYVIWMNWNPRDRSHIENQVQNL